MKFKLKLIILVSFLLASAPALSITTQELIKEYIFLFNHCRKVGFYVCEDTSFMKEGARGDFYKPIQMQHVKLMEDRYENFIKNKYPDNYIKLSFMKVKMDFDSVPEFNISLYKPSEIKHMQTMNADETIFRIDYKNARSIYLTNEGQGFRIAIHPDDQKAAMKTKEYKTAYLAMLKANILRYHIIEAELLDLDRSTLESNINEALAPLVKWAQGDEMPDYVKKYIKRSPDEIRDFYAPILNDEVAKKLILGKRNN